MKKTITNKARHFGLKLTVMLFALLLFASGEGWGQTNSTTPVLLDNYDGTGDLTYANNAASQWSITGGIYVAGTNALSTPEHSCASYDLTNSITGWSLAKANQNVWIGYFKMLRTTSGWGTTNYGCGSVLACNLADFSSASAQGYALVIENGTTDKVTLVRFSQGIKDGAINLPSNATSIVSVAVDPGTTGFNFLVELLSDGKWKISYITGAQLSDANAIVKSNYSGGNATSVSADETYTGSSYKYSGWVFSHSSGNNATDKANFDNFGAAQASSGPSAPTVTSSAATSIGTTAATLNGNVTSDGGATITERGFCYKTSSGVTISDNKTTVSGTTGSFTLTPTLSAGQQYYFKAYAINSEGTTLSSPELSFYTLSNEPTNHAASFSAVASSQTQIDLTFSAASTITDADGYLILQRSGAAPTGAPTDANAYTVGTAIGDGTVAAIITNTADVSKAITGLSAGTHYYFTLFPYNWDGSSATTYNYKTDGSVPGADATTDAPLDATSKVEAPTSQTAAGNIASTATSSGSAVEVFKFKISDLATTDAVATKVTQVKIKKSSGTADWTDHIAGASLWDGVSQITTGTVTITDADITFPITSGNLDIASGSNKEITLKIWLNTTNIVDNSTMVFTISQTSHGLTADATGSTFTTDFGAAVTGNIMTVSVEATKLAFVQQPTNVGTSANISPAVTVSANDANNNRDLDYVTNVFISATGLTNSPVSAIPVSGLATFSTLSFASASTGVTLEASSGSLTNVTSNSFDVLLIPAAGEIVINQISPDYNGASDEYIELVNRTNKTFDLSQLKIEYQSSSGSSGSAGGNLTGSLGPFQFWLLSPNASITVGQTSSLARDGSITAGFAASAGQLALRLKNSPNTIIDGIAYGSVSPNNLGEGTSTSSPPTDGGLKRVTEGIDNNANSTDYTTVTQANIYLRNSSSVCIASTYLLPSTSYSKDVVLSGSTPAVTLTGNTTISGKLSILSGSLTIASNQTLTISGTLTNTAGTSGLVIKSDATGTGSLIHSTASQSATVERYLASAASSPYWKWHFIAAPVSGQKITGSNNFIDFSNSPENVDFYKYDPSNATTPWINIKDNSGNLNTADWGADPEFAVGAGYLVSYNSASSAKSFRSTLNTGDQNITITAGKYNLIGNPFPSAITWTGSNYTGLASDYVWVYNENKDGGAGFETFNSGTIAPMQGFFIQSDAATSITIANSIRTHNSSTFYKNSNAAVDELILKFSNGNNWDIAQIQFMDNASANNDRNDAMKLFSLDANIPQIYSMTDNNHLYTINAMPTLNTSVSIPVGIYVPANGNYSITADGLSNLSLCSTITLEDLKTNFTQDLLTNPVYNFAANTNDNANRFILHFATVLGINQNTPSNGGIYAYNNNIYVNTAGKISSIEIFNTLGQLVYRTQNVNGLQKISLQNKVSGYYIVKVVTDANTFTNKVWVK